MGKSKESDSLMNQASIELDKPFIFRKAQINWKNTDKVFRPIRADNMFILFLVRVIMDTLKKDILTNG